MFTVGVFQDGAWADRGIAALVADGFAPDSLSVLVKASPEADALIRERFGSPGVAVTSKGLGALIANGPFLRTLQGEDSALTTSTLAATIRRAGFQSHDGYIFQALVERGGVLVAVETEPRAADALAILHAYGGGNAAIGAWTGRV